MNKGEARAAVMSAISMVLKDPVLQQGFEIICKKNAELEKENKELKERDCWKYCEYANPKAELIGQHITDVQNLAKAKEIITYLLRYPYHANEADFLNRIAEAEAFLKECEKEVD